MLGKPHIILSTVYQTEFTVGWPISSGSCNFLMSDLLLNIFSLSPNKALITEFFKTDSIHNRVICKSIA